MRILKTVKDAILDYERKKMELSYTFCM